MGVKLLLVGSSELLLVLVLLVVQLLFWSQGVSLLEHSEPLDLFILLLQLLHHSRLAVVQLRITLRLLQLLQLLQLDPLFFVHLLVVLLLLLKHQLQLLLVVQIIE